MKLIRWILPFVLALGIAGCIGSPTAPADLATILPTRAADATSTQPMPPPTVTETAVPTASPTPFPSPTDTPMPPAVYHNAFAVGFFADGSRLVFNAGDFGDGSMHQPGRDRAYLYETDGGEVSRIGATGSRAASLSANGRYVLLYGRENALEPLADHESYYLLVDLQTGQEERVDFSELNKELYGSTRAYLSPDGQSMALTFFTNTGRGDVDLYLQDRATGERVKVTEGTGSDYGSSASYYPTFSPDGGWLVFLSSAANLVEGDQACSEANPDCTDVFVYEIATGQLARIPANITLSMGTPTFRLAVTNGARWIAWADSEEGGGTFWMVIRLHDRQTGETEKICGVEEACLAHTPALSADGRWLAYVAYEENEAESWPPESHVYLLDRQTGERTLISADEAGEAGDAQSGTTTLQSEGFGSDLQISGDGRFVAFSSQAANLLPDGAEKRQCFDPIMIGEYTCYDLFVYDRESGRLSWVRPPEQ